MSAPGFHQFLTTAPPAQLGPEGRPGTQSLEKLSRDLAPLLKESGLSETGQQLVRALILLWHDHLDAAHTLAQEIDNPDGAFVHGIMHRREPDFGNAGYWFRRVGPHGVFPAIARRVGETLQEQSERTLSGKLVRDGQWDPFAFIDACAEATRKATASKPLLQQCQRIEFEELLGWLQSQ